MAEAFAAEIAATLLVKLTSAAFQQISSMWGVRDEFEKLKDVLMAIKAVLARAELKQIHNQDSSFWLLKFKEACYEVEHLLDEFEIEALRKQVLNLRITGGKVRHFFSGSNSLTFRIRMGRKIKKVKEMLDEIATNKSRFHLVENHQVKNVIHGERETYSFVKTSDVLGRDEAKKDIVDFLMNPSAAVDREDDIPVLPIVGIGGIGKTALAQMVFNDQSVEKHFDLRIWVCVTTDFDIKQLMIKIIKSATGMECKDKNKEELCKVLRDCLSGKIFLVVLDDVWNDDKKKWIELKDLMSGGAHGSKIVLTTRSHKVATITGTIPQYDLQLLSYDNCLSLFLKLAFKKGEETKHQNLVRIGEDIVPKCGGVALAVKTLGGLLCSTRVQHDWELVRDSEIWKLEHKENDILPALKLSYDHLPWYLKQCFSFCSVFPKDYHFNSAQLISMWMANGFLQPSNNNEEAEDIGNRYLHELWSRSFFQQFEDMIFYFKFKMHDLVHDLALSVAQNEVNSLNQNSSGNVRHLWFDLSRQSSSQLPNNLVRVQSLIFESSEERKANSESLVAKCVSSSKQLKVLDLGDCNLEELQDNIRFSKHLRYLSIGGNGNIKKIPNSICHLQSLQTLILLECKEMEELPKDIGYLISLRVLGVTTKQASLQGYRIECLSSLRVLLFVGCDNLISLPQGLKYLTALETLIIGQCEKLDLSMEMELEGKEDGSLRKLIIVGLPKVESLPKWILLGSTNTLQELWIGGLENLLTLPTWFQHLTSLQRLRIEGCPKLSSLPEGMQHLTALNELEIEECPELSERCIREIGEDWPKIAHVPQLHLINKSETSTTDDE